MPNKNSTVIGTFTGKCCQGNVENNNQMTLPTELFQKLFESDEYKTAIKNRYYLGYLGHPEDPGCMDYEHACITMTECHVDDNGEVYGTFDLIDTPVGRIVKAFIDAGVTFGISIRGAGDVDGAGNVDPDTFVFRGFDLVTFPAYDDAVPVFREIAASSDLDKQVKFKKVCAAIEHNLSDINSCEAIDVIKEQFNTNSKEYAKLEKREAEITNSEDVVASLTEQQLAGMTNLYLDQVEANRQLLEKLDKVTAATIRKDADTERRIKSIERITAAQVTNLKQRLSSTENSNRTLVAASARLKEENKSLSESNLIYCHKIEANSDTICQKDSTISSLKAKLGETVTASKVVEKRASNLDVKVERMKAKVEAAEQMVFEYQKAYANLYANALGVSLKDIPVTANTSVEELGKIISGATSTSNIGVAPCLDTEIVEVIDEDEEDGIVSV